MRLIVGLGNPGAKYKNTRHNIGFMTVDLLATELYKNISNSKFKAKYTKASYNGEELIILQPQTYMNLSGESVLAAANFFKIKTEDILVIHDELDIEFGKFKFKNGGGFAGHKGLKSMGALLGKNSFHRIRVGIGRPTGRESVSDYVLHNFSSEESVELEDIVKEVVKSIFYYLDNGIIETMNQFHGG